MPSQPGSAKSVLEELKRGVPPEGLAIKKPYEEFERGDLDELLKLSRHMRENQLSYNLLVYLFRISNGKNLWYSAEVLSQAVQHPIMATVDRQSILRTMRNRLDRIKDEITAEPPSGDKLRKYWLMEATYYAVSGATLVETGHKIEANQNYQIAQGIFEQLGLTQQAEKYKQISQDLAKDESTGKLASMNAEPTRPAPPAIPVKPGPETLANNLKPMVESPTQAAPPPGVIHLPGPPAQAATPIQPPVQPGQTAMLSSELIPPVPVEPQPVHPVDPAATPSGEPAIPPVPTVRASTDVFRPLPDVWMQEGQLHFQSMPPGDSDASRRQVEQIQQQSEILAGIQMQILMYLDRRSFLEREVQNLEKKVTTLKTRVERLEKKIDRLEEPK